MKFLILFFISSLALSSNVGMSSMPLTEYKNSFSTEIFTNINENYSDPGIQLQYLYSATKKIGFDGGLRISKEDRIGLFVAGSYVFFKDYNNQPRLSLRGFFERDRINSLDLNSFGASPTISKGLNFFGVHTYPYAALPTKLVIIENSDDLEFASSLSLGVATKIPFEQMKDFVAIVEGNINLKNTSNNLSLGLSMNF